MADPLAGFDRVAPDPLEGFTAESDPLATFEALDGKSLLDELTAAFIPRAPELPPGTPEPVVEPFVGVPSRIPGAHIAEGARIGLAARFPIGVAGYTLTRGLAERALGPTPVGPPPVEGPVLGGTGFEELGAGLPGAGTLAAELAGAAGGFGGDALTRALAGRIAAVRGAAAPSLEGGPPPEFTKALPPAPDVIPAPGPTRLFEAGPSTLPPPGRAARAATRAIETGVEPALPRQLMRESDRIERVIQFPLGKTPKEVTRKAALLNAAEAAERRGPRVIDPETGRPVFAPGEPISGPRAEATARIGRDPVGRPDLPSEELAVSLESPGGRGLAATDPLPDGASIDDIARQMARPPRTYNLPIRGGIDLPDSRASLPGTPPEVAAVAAAERPFPPETNRWSSLGDWLRQQGQRALARTVSEKQPLGYSLAEQVRRFNLLNLVTTTDDATHAIVNGGQLSSEHYGAWLHNWQRLGQRLARDETGNALSGEVMTKALRIMQRFQDDTLGAFRAIQREVPQALSAMRSYRQLNDSMLREAIKRGRLTAEDAKFVNYVPFWRDKHSVDQRLLLQVDNYFPSYIDNSLPKPARLAFQRARVKNTIPDLDWDNTWRLQGATLGRMFAIDDVFMPIVRENLPRVGKDFQKMARVVVNNHLGVPGFSRDAPREITRLLKTFAGGRTLALSPSSPLHNMTQMVNTLADSSVSEFAQGLKALGDPKAWALARERGVISTFTKADIDRAAEFGSKAATMLSRGLARAVTWGLGMFRGSEMVLRVQSFHTGLAQAARRGLAGEKALQFAANFVRRNQFALGAETSVLTQFKPYVTGQMIRLGDYALEAEAGFERFARGLGTMNSALMRDGLSRLRGPAKFWTASTLLFGGDVTGANWALENATEAMFGPEGRYKVTGLMPALGLTMANQVALGVIPVQNLRDFMFFLPGPFMAGVGDAISAITYWASEATGQRNPLDGGLGVKASPTDLANASFGGGFRPEDVGEVTARATRAFPGVQVNRLREFARAMANSGYNILGEEDVRLPASASEAYGLEPSRGELLRRAGSEEKLFRLFGIGVEQAEEEREARGRIQRRERDVAATRSSAGKLFKAGQISRSFAEFEALARRHGIDAMAQAMLGLPEAVVTAFRSDVMTRQERQVLTGPRAGLPGRVQAAKEPKSAERAVLQWLLGR